MNQILDRKKTHNRDVDQYIDKKCKIYSNSKRHSNDKKEVKSKSF